MGQRHAPQSHARWSGWQSLIRAMAAQGRLINAVVHAPLAVQVYTGVQLLLARRRSPFGGERVVLPETASVGCAGTVQPRLRAR
jgi:hypothetical protein